jgi:MoaA/NifB/PqqE/SkfB family radical SAM enzyme
LIGYGLVEIDVSVTDLYNDSDVYLDGVNRAKTRLENLENLVKRFKGKILVTASSVLTRKAVGNLQEIESVLYNIGVDRWRLREVLVSESNETAEYLYGDPREFASTLIGFAAAEHKIPITGYLYDVIATKRKDRRCSNLERNYIYVNYNREVYWLARLSNKSFDEFRGNNIPEIAYNLHNVCYQLEIPHRCINCPANYFCVESPYCAFEIPLSN